MRAIVRFLRARVRRLFGYDCAQDIDNMKIFDPDTPLLPEEIKGRRCKR